MRAQSFFAAVATLSALSSTLALSTSDVAKAFQAAKLTPNVIPSFTPIALLDITYSDAGQNISVTPGKSLTVNQTASRPQFALSTNNASLAGGSFVLVMFDPDAPTPQNPTLSQIRHLVASVDVAANVTTAALTSAEGVPLTNSTPAVWDYVSPAPPAGSDPHRYTLLLFTKPATFDAQVSRLVNASSPITNFDVRSFAKSLGLGAPVAGNFFSTGPVGGSNSSSTKNGKSAAVAGVQVHFGALATAVSVVGAMLGAALL